MRYKHKPNEVNVARWNGVNSLEIENIVGAENVLYKPFDNEDTRAGNVEEYGKLFILIDNNFMTIPLHSFIIVDENKNITIYELEEKFNNDYEIIE